MCTSHLYCSYGSPIFDLWIVRSKDNTVAEETGAALIFIDPMSTF
jgi:hypothetical protein